MNDFETELRSFEPRPAPAEWRAEILDAMHVEANETGAEQDPRQWFPVQTFSIAAVWLLIAVLRFSMPRESAEPVPVSLAQLEARVRMQEALVAELFNPPHSPVSQPRVPRGAMSPAQTTHSRRA